MNTILVQLQSVLDAVLISSIQASFLICVIVALRLILRERLSPRWRSMLWLLMLIRLSMPYAPDSALSIYNVFSEAAVESNDDMAGDWGMRYLPHLGGDFLKLDEEADLAVETGSQGEHTEGRADMNLPAVMLLIWISGAGFIVLYVLWRTLLLKAKFRTTKCVTNQQLQQLLEACKYKVGVRTDIRIEEIPGLRLPMLYGAFRPRLLFPEGMLDELTVNEKRHIILHELAHHKRRDILLNYWMMLIKSLNWFNPLVWYAFSKARQDTELACDALALSRMGEADTQGYGRTLIKLLEVSSGWHRWPIPAGILRNPREVKSRLRMITNYQRNSFLSSLTISGAALVLGVLFLTDAERQSVHAWESNSTEISENGELPGVRTSVMHQGDRVWLDKVDRPSRWDQKEANTYISALRVVLSALGENATYDQLMGVSGAAFRIQFYDSNWCPSAQSAPLGFDCAEPAARAFGYSLSQWLTYGELNTPTGVRDVRAAVVESIDSGHPVIAVNLMGERFEWEMDWGVITGYEEMGKVFLARTKRDNSEVEHERATTWPVIIHAPIKEKETPDWRESIIQSLRIASLLARTDKFTYYKSGFAAYEAWIDGLRDESRFKELDQVQLNRYIQSNAYCYYRLHTDRAVAARYLEKNTHEFSGEIAEHLSRAGQLYAQITDVLYENRDMAPLPGQLRNNPWTQEMRQEQANVLGEALALEKKAIGAIESAVSLISQGNL